MHKPLACRSCKHRWLDCAADEACKKCNRKSAKCPVCGHDDVVKLIRRGNKTRDLPTVILSK